MMKTVNRESFAFLKKSQKFHRLADTELLPAIVGPKNSAFAYFDQKQYEKAANTMKDLSNLLLNHLYELDPVLQTAQNSRDAWLKLGFPLKVMRLADLHLLSQKVRKELIDEGRPDLFDKSGAMRKLSAFADIMLFFMQRYEEQQLPADLQENSKTKSQNQFSQDDLETAIAKTQAKLPGALSEKSAEQEAKELPAAFKEAGKGEMGRSSFLFYLLAILLVFAAGLFLKVDRLALLYGLVAAGLMALLLLIIQASRRHGVKKRRRLLTQQGAAFQRRYQEIATEEADEIASFNEEEDPYPALKNGRQSFSLLHLPQGLFLVRNIYEGKLLRQQLVYDRRGHLQQRRQFLPGQPLYLLTTFAPEKKQNFVTASGQTYSLAACQDRFSSRASEKRKQALRQAVEQRLQQVENLKPAENLNPWFGKQLIQPEMALQMLQTTEYYGRQFVDGATLSLRQDLSKKNLVGLDYLNSRFMHYDQLRGHFLARLHHFEKRSQEPVLNKRVLEVGSLLKTEPFFAGAEKIAAFAQFQKELAADAIRQLINHQQDHAQPVLVINDLLLPGFYAAPKVKLAHLVISAKGLFILDTRRVNLETDVYTPNNDQKLKPLRQRIIKERKALVAALRRAANENSAARPVVQLLLSQRSIFNLLLIINSGNREKQDFRIAHSDFDSGAAQTTNIGISNLKDLPRHLFGRQDNDLHLKRSEMTTIANLLQQRPNVTATESENYVFFPQVGWNFGDDEGNTAEIADQMSYLDDLLQAIDLLGESMEQLVKEQAQMSLFKQARDELDLTEKIDLEPASLKEQI